MTWLLDSNLTDTVLTHPFVFTIHAGHWLYQASQRRRRFFFQTPLSSNPVRRNPSLGTLCGLEASAVAYWQHYRRKAQSARPPRAKGRSVPRGNLQTNRLRMQIPYAGTAQRIHRKKALSMSAGIEKSPIQKDRGFCLSLHVESVVDFSAFLQKSLYDRAHLSGQIKRTQHHHRPAGRPLDCVGKKFTVHHSRCGWHAMRL